MEYGTKVPYRAVCGASLGEHGSSILNHDQILTGVDTAALERPIHQNFRQHVLELAVPKDDS